MLSTYNSLFQGSILLQGILIAVSVSSAVLLIARLITTSEFWEKLNPPCDLPVLNLEGRQFAKAKHEYLTNLGKYLQIGREKVCSLHRMSFDSSHGC